MKSLELINENLNIAKAIQREGLDCYEEIKELEQIKQDLEVLEIIRKKKVDFVHLNNYLFLYEKNEEVLEKYNKYCFYQNELTIEELLKLNQWLEVHENED